MAIDETIPGACVVHRELRFDIDLEMDGFSAHPAPFFGIADISQTVTGSCTGVLDGCRASLHLTRRD